MAQLGDELRAMMSPHHRPRYVELYEALPRTETHKVRKGVLRSEGTRGIAERTWDAVEHAWAQAPQR